MFFKNKFYFHFHFWKKITESFWKKHSTPRTSSRVMLGNATSGPTSSTPERTFSITIVLLYISRVTVCDITHSKKAREFRTSIQHFVKGPKFSPLSLYDCMRTARIHLFNLDHFWDRLTSTNANISVDYQKIQWKYLQEVLFFAKQVVVYTRLNFVHRSGVSSRVFLLL